jgi:hypothetical protein
LYGTEHDKGVAEIFNNWKDQIEKFQYDAYAAGNFPFCTLDRVTFAIVLKWPPGQKWRFVF